MPERGIHCHAALAIAHTGGRISAALPGGGNYHTCIGARAVNGLRGRTNQKVQWPGSMDEHSGQGGFLTIQQAAVQYE